MKKIFFSLVGLLTVLTLHAQTFDNQEATISWPVGNETEGTLSENISDAISFTGVTVGSDLTITSTSTK